MQDEAVVSAGSTQVSPEENTVGSDEKSWVGGIGQLSNLKRKWWEVWSADTASRSYSLAGMTGLYTSPHLCAVRERIRINGHPLPEPLFAKYFFEVWDRLSAHSSSSSSIALDPIPNPHVPQEHFSTIPEKPVYFRFLTLLAFHVFLSLRIKLTVLEVGMGGTYDSTNVVPRPLVTGVTALGLDHTFMLGDTVEEIAGNKSGIFKEGVPALAVVQEKSAKRGEFVLRERANELEVSDAVFKITLGVLVTNKVGSFGCTQASSFELVPVYPEVREIKLGESWFHPQALVCSG